ncbi:MAG: GFA family protein [Alphaproteobacteria bacterium]|nr:GFA family protein [Alphaproteobacteria bacterium]
MTGPPDTKGRCLCGAVSYEGRGALKGVSACHCRDCARWVGGPALTAEFTEGFAIEGPVRWWRSSEWGERGSCAQCGAALFWRAIDGSIINAGAGFFDDPTQFQRIDLHIFVDRKPAFYDFADDAPRLTGDEYLAALQASS